MGMYSKFLLGAITFASLIFVFNPVFAQESVDTSEQTTLSKDLENNPLAQEILQKIEQSKKWIAELEQRNYEQLEAQKELEAKRSHALEKLKQDLAEWEKLWDYYSPRNSFERFVDKIPSSDVQGVFWDQFEFTEMKTNAGQEALKKVIANGGSLSEARQAYHKAAETKRIELIEANSLFNVNHNLAYYNQQVLFNTQGQFVETPITGEELRKYYEDYRTNPAYLDANPNDAISWEALRKTNSDTECREGQVVVYRFHAKDYVCVTMYTAEMWIRHGMGEITGDSQGITSSENTVNPLTKCNDGFITIFTIESEKYSCVLEETAKQWIEQGIAEIHNPESYILERINDKETSLKIQDINQKIKEFKIELQEKQIELKKNYDEKYDNVLVQSKENEKKAIIDHNERSGMTKEELSNKIYSIRKQHESTQDDILQEKIESLKMLEDEYKIKLKNFADNYQFDKDIKIVWNSDKSSYDAVRR